MKDYIRNFSVFLLAALFGIGLSVVFSVTDYSAAKVSAVDLPSRSGEVLDLKTSDEVAIHDGSGETVTAPALALDADPAPMFIQRRASVIIPARQINTNWIHAYTRSREHGHEITTAIHYPAQSRLPAGGYA